MVDYGSRDAELTAITAEVRSRLVGIANGGDDYSAVLLQGSGTFVVEAAIGTLVPKTGRLLVLINGAYGRRIAAIARRLGRPVLELARPEHRMVNLGALDAALAADPSITHVAVVHCETTTGLLNPLRQVAEIVTRHGRRLLVDAMSAFGALELDLAVLQADCVLSCSNKCLEGVPGVGFAICRTESLRESEGRCPSVVLDLHEQWARFERDGQWRFTPPTHVLASFVAALRAHEVEGGVPGRGARYRRNCATLVGRMRMHGFQTLLPDRLQAPIIVTFRQPADFDFDAFYEGLAERGWLIYPGKLTEVPTFRVGCIGQVFPEDMEAFTDTVAEVLA